MVKRLLLIEVFCLCVQLQVKAQPITDTFYVIADAEVYENDPNTNDGAGMNMVVGTLAYGIARAYIRFDLSSIPSTAIISGANLYLMYLEGYGAANQNVEVCRVTGDWQEMTITWNNAPGFSSAYHVTSIPVSPTLVWHSWPVCSMVQEWVNGTYPNYGMVIKYQDETPQANDIRIFDTKDVPPADTGYLVVTYLYGVEEKSIHYGRIEIYPTLMHGSAEIRYAIPTPSFVDLKLYDITGKVVRTLLANELISGTGSIRWDGKGDDGIALPNGVYFVNLKYDRFVTNKKVILIRD